MFKKFIKWFWPILLRAILLTIEKEVQQHLRKTDPFKMSYKAEANRPDRRLEPYDIYRSTKRQLSPDAVDRQARRIRDEVFEDPNYGYIGYGFYDRAEADEVLAYMMHIVHQYGSASVGDFYELLGHASRFVDSQWGWKDLSKVNIKETDDGWVLKMVDEPVRI